MGCCMSSAGGPLDPIVPADMKPVPSNVKGVKRALLIGLNYPGSKFELSGCHNDVKREMELLHKIFGFKHENIVALTDAPSQPVSGAQMKKAMAQTVAACSPGDVLFIHFSGHGTQVVDPTEADGNDEALVPNDFNLVVDDDIFDIVRKLPPGVKLTMVCDCCHSEGMLDSPQVQITGVESPHKQRSSESWKSRDIPAEEVANALGTSSDAKEIRSGIGKKFGSDAGAIASRPVMSKQQKTAKRTVEQVHQNITLISGCRSCEKSGDVKTADGRAFGVMTDCLARVLTEHFKAEPTRLITNQELVEGVRAAVVKKGHRTQNPCLECTEYMAQQPFIVY